MNLHLENLQRIAGMIFPRRADAPESRKLTFRLTNEYPDKVLIADAGKFRSAGQYGKISVYSVGSAPLSAAEVRIAEMLKANLIMEHADDIYGHGMGFRDRIETAYRLAISYPGISSISNKGLIAYAVAHDTAGYGPFSILLDDAKDIEEIMVDRADSNIGIYHTKLGYCRTNLAFTDVAGFRFNTNRMIEGSGSELAEEQPIIDSQLMDGSRVHAQLKNQADGGGVLAIRLNGGKRFGIDRLIREETASAEMMAYVWMAIETGYNIVIAGAPATGKTSLLLSLLSFVPRYERVIIIEEEANELVLSSNFISSVNLNGTQKGRGADMEAQVSNALHMRPDRLVIGELRGAETRDVFSAANLGVPFMATMHSNTYGQSLIERLTTKPMSVEPEAVHSLDMALFMKRSNLYGRSIDRITEYKWITRAETKIESIGSNAYEQTDIFAHDGQTPDALKRSKVLDGYAEKRLMTARRARSELTKRKDYLEDAIARGAEIEEAIQQYS